MKVTRKLWLFIILLFFSKSLNNKFYISCIISKNEITYKIPFRRLFL